jgi:T-complex protein 1 subunit eta
MGGRGMPGGGMGMQPSIILLKEGTDTSQGKAQLISNINACAAVADIVRTTLGPRGMDKLIHSNGKVVISNDGATIMKTLEIVHPAAKSMVDISMAQDSEAGDGTTSVVVLANEFMKEAKQYVEEGVHPQLIIRSYREAGRLAISKLKEWAIDISGKDEKERRELLVKCAATSLNSKLISHQKDFFAPIVVDAVCSLDEDLSLDMIGIKKVPGGALEDSFLVHGVAFKKTFSYAGFEQQPKMFDKPKVCLLNVELELKSEKENAEIRLTDPEQYQSIVDAEWNIIYEKLDKITATGAKVVLSRLAIGDLATQYFADRDIFCAGRVEDADMRRVAKACGAAVQTSIHNLIPEVIGECGAFEEKQIGDERYNVFSGCPEAKTTTIVLRGGAEQFIAETERSIHDSVMIVRRAVKNSKIVPGGGAIEMELSKFLRMHARTIYGKAQLIINSYAKALEVIPRQLSDNAGFDSTDILNRLRQKHQQPGDAGRWFGVDVDEEGICDSYEKFVWEPLQVKLSALSAATEACNVILSVDETITNPQSEQPQGGGGMGRGRGRGGRGRGMPRRR